MLHAGQKLKWACIQKDSLFRAICELPLLTKRESWPCARPGTPLIGIRTLIFTAQLKGQFVC